MNALVQRNAGDDKAECASCGLREGVRWGDEGGSGSGESGTRE